MANLGKTDQILPGGLDELCAMAQQAFAAGEDTKASRFYSMAIDKLAKGLKVDADGVASDADLRKLNKSSEGKLAQLLAARSEVHLKKGDIAAAEEDAATSIRADVSCEEGHLRLLAVFEAAGAPLHGQLEVCERGLLECPVSEQLVTRKWALKRAMASEPQDGDEAAAGTAVDDAVTLRNRGLMLLKLDQPVEAAEALAAAAEAGDEEAAEVLLRISKEAENQHAEALAKLESMAVAGDKRAKAMLEELRAGSLQLINAGA